MVNCRLVQCSGVVYSDIAYIHITLIHFLLVTVFYDRDKTVVSYQLFLLVLKEALASEITIRLVFSCCY